MGVPRWTTPTLTLTFTEAGLDLTQASGVYVTMSSGKTKLTKTGADLDISEKQIVVSLTQEETGRFGLVVEIQANWLVNGKRIASDIARVSISDQLLNEVIR